MRRKERIPLHDHSDDDSGGPVAPFTVTQAAGGSSGGGSSAAADAHIVDTTDAHDASAISIVDAGTYFTGTDVEAALQELGAGGGGGGSLTDHTHAVTGSGASGGGASLAPTTLILPQGTTPAQTAEGSAVWDTDDDKLTIGTGAARKTMVNEGAVTGSGLTQATARLLGRTTASTGAIEEITVGTGLSLSAGSLTATGGAATITTKDEGSTLSSTVTTLDFVGAGVTASGAGATTTITIPGGGSSALVLLESHTASASATLDFTAFVNSALYDDYLFVVSGLVAATNNVDLYMRVSTNGGSSYAAGGSDYHTAVFAWASSGTANTGGTTDRIMVRNTGEMSNATTASVNGWVRLHVPHSTALHKRVDGEFSYYTVNTVRAIIGATYLSTTAVNAFRFLFSSGNIASGSIRVYGIAK